MAKNKIRRSVRQAALRICSKCQVCDSSDADVVWAGGQPGKGLSAVRVLCSQHLECRAPPLREEQPSPEEMAVMAGSVRVSQILEESRKKATRAEKLRWKGWSHLERRLQERLLPGKTQAEISDHASEIVSIIGRHLPPTLLLKKRRGTFSLLIKVGDRGGPYLSFEGGAFWLKTWFPTSDSWQGVGEPWAIALGDELLEYVNSIP
ncbi:MAG: hypothetical protein EB165_04355 [Euryarchaeota archaeon]|nr:hypothetical protein [Euryarchaeota archaeon]NDB93863.1 hypothetical protein [Euryarchaeota archaeon]